MLKYELVPDWLAEIYVKMEDATGVNAYYIVGGSTIVLLSLGTYLIFKKRKKKGKSAPKLGEFTLANI